jgi:hypothetical protein
MYMEVTLYPGMSILKKSGDLTPTPQKGEENYANLKARSHLTSGTRDLRTPVAMPLQPPRTLCLVAIIRNFPKITLVGPTLRHLYPHR